MSNKSFRERYKYWKETGELPYSNGLIKDLPENQSEGVPVKSRLPGYDGGKDGMFIKYVDSYRVNPETGGIYDKVGDVREGAVILDPVEVVGLKPEWMRMQEEAERMRNILSRQGLSGADPIGLFAVETVALNPVFKALGTAGLYTLGRYGESLTGFAKPLNWARAKLLTREMDRSPFGTIGSPVLQSTKRTKVGDVEIDNPGLYYHQSDAGKAKHFVETGRMRTPLEEYWLAKDEAGEPIPMKIRSGIEPGFPQDPGSAMFAQGDLWYGLTPKKPDLLVTAREMPIANKNASVMSDKASLRSLENQGTRRVTNDNIYTQGPHNRQNTSAYTWEPGYGYRRVLAEETPIAEWPMGRTAPQITAENAASIVPENTLYKNTVFDKNKLYNIFKNSNLNNTKIIDNNAYSTVFKGIDTHLFDNTKYKYKVPNLTLKYNIDTNPTNLGIDFNNLIDYSTFVKQPESYWENLYKQIPEDDLPGFMELYYRAHPDVPRAETIINGNLNNSIDMGLPLARRGVKSATVANKAAINDLIEMNKYHTDNVAAYNEATGSNLISKPFKTEYPGYSIKVLPDEEFNKIVDVNRTNSPIKDVRNVGGMHSWRDNTTYLRQRGTPNTDYHEFLHRGDYGVTNPEVTRWRIQQLIDPEKLKEITPEIQKYLTSEAEFPVHLRQKGELMGIKVGQEYPGDIAFDALMAKSPMGGATALAKGTAKSASSEDKQLLWKALNGTLFGGASLLTLGATSTLYGKRNRKR